jgi:subtilisin family serine protease
MVSVAVGCTGFILAADLVRGLKWIARDCKRQARCIVNISLKNGNYPTTNQAVQDLLDVGALVVVSAGNDSSDACFNWPNTDLLVVGATRQDDTAAPWSNFGSCVDLYAPGEGVWTITNGTIGTTYKSGTSYSAPHVSGLAAIYWELHPSATAAEVRDAITGNATPDVILGANPNWFIYSMIPREF